MVGVFVRKLAVHGATVGAKFAVATCTTGHPIPANDAWVQQLCTAPHKGRRTRFESRRPHWSRFSQGLKKSDVNTSIRSIRLGRSL